MSGAATSDWSSVTKWFDDLVELAASEREVRLVKGRLPSAIANDVRSLLAAADLTGVFERRADLLLEAIPQDVYASLKSGTVVGPFVVDRLIGRGGMGEIYAAHRSHPSFEQRVALKLLRP